MLARRSQVKCINLRVRDIASPSYFLVDPVAVDILTYHNVIAKPMDRSTVQSKQKAGRYENAKELETAVRLIFKDCFSWNVPGDPTNVAGQKCEEVFNPPWAAKARWVEQRDPDGHNQSGSSDEESEEEEDRKKLQVLQRPSAGMSKQMEATTQKKKKTPPPSKRSGKSKSGKRNSKRSKSGKSKKRHVAYISVRGSK